MLKGASNNEMSLVKLDAPEVRQANAVIRPQGATPVTAHMTTRCEE